MTGAIQPMHIVLVLFILMILAVPVVIVAAYVFLFRSSPRVEIDREALARQDEERRG